jgi:hypothetical protein
MTLSAPSAAVEILLQQVRHGGDFEGIDGGILFLRLLVRQVRRLRGRDAAPTVLLSNVRRSRNRSVGNACDASRPLLLARETSRHSAGASFGKETVAGALFGDFGQVQAGGERQRLAIEVGAADDEDLAMLRRPVESPGRSSPPSSRPLRQ